MKNTNYFGRICRLFGRMSLFAGFILCVGVGALLIINPFLGNDPSTAKTIGSTISGESLSSGVSQYFAATFFSQNQALSTIITIIVTIVVVIAIAFLAKRYNAAMRKIIANLAKRAHVPIHMMEMGLSLIVWSLLIIMLYFSFPYATVFLIFPFIFNELFFLFGWISYGLPEYKV